MLFAAMGLSAAVRFVAMRCRSVGRAVILRGPRPAGVGLLAVCLDLVAIIAAPVLCLSSAFVSTVGNAADAAVIPAATVVHKTMAAPAMVIAITCPRAHAHEDPIVEIT